jgi:hypothetical protein
VLPATRSLVASATADGPIMAAARATPHIQRARMAKSSPVPSP